MLKVKDNVDLKELEKYGLEFTSSSDGRLCCYMQDEDFWFPSGLMVDKDTRIIKLHSGEYDFNLRDWTGKHTTILYNLIKADLVEKVGE